VRAGRVAAVGLHGMSQPANSPRRPATAFTTVRCGLREGGTIKRRAAIERGRAADTEALR
jgi:hypothetical protein